MTHPTESNDQAQQRIAFLEAQNEKLLATLVAAKDTCSLPIILQVGPDQYQFVELVLKQLAEVVVENKELTYRLDHTESVSRERRQRIAKLMEGARFAGDLLAKFWPLLDQPAQEALRREVQDFMLSRLTLPAFFNIGQVEAAYPHLYQFLKNTAQEEAGNDDQA